MMITVSLLFIKKQKKFTIFNDENMWHVINQRCKFLSHQKVNKDLQFNVSHKQQENATFYLYLNENFSGQSRTCITETFLFYCFSIQGH